MKPTLISLLDHGYLELVESWGSDERIVEAARMSTGKGFLGWGPKAWKCNGCGAEQPYDHPTPILPCAGCNNAHVVERALIAKGFSRIDGDEKLLRYLYENKHATPFEMAGCIIEVQAPIFVFREWHRHRTQSYNEMSARYAPLPDVNYLPTVERLLLGGGHLTKQAAAAAGVPSLDQERAEGFIASARNLYVAAEFEYQKALNGGVPKELARIVLPVGRYSRMRASANLRNWLGFMTLRCAPQAQYEIRQYANALHEVLVGLFPRTMALFDEGVADG